MPDNSEHRLQVLIANERDDRLASVTAIVTGLGHEVVGRAVSVAEVGPLSRTTGAEVALVGLGLDGPHALEQISAIVHEAACPVIALLDAADQSFVEEAAKRGVFAYVVLRGDDSREVQNALDITLRRFAEFQNLQGAFGRRALIEQAKGILMERHGITADAAFELLKSHSQQSGQRLISVAEALLQAHQLLACLAGRQDVIPSQNAYPFATTWASTVEPTPRKGEPMEGIETNAPHHQLLHLVEAAQLAGYSEREIVEIVEAELDTDAELDQAA